MNEPPEEDSPDLTDAEVLGAAEVAGAADLVKHIQGAKCDQCLGPVSVNGHALRRRAPHLYWRILLVCRSGHHSSQVFQTDWVRGETP